MWIRREWDTGRRRTGRDGEEERRKSCLSLSPDGSEDGSAEKERSSHRKVDNPSLTSLSLLIRHWEKEHFRAPALTASNQMPACELTQTKDCLLCVCGSATPFFSSLSFPSISCQSPETACHEIATHDEDSLIPQLTRLFEEAEEKAQRKDDRMVGIRDRMGSVPDRESGCEYVRNSVKPGPAVFMLISSMKE